MRPKISKSKLRKSVPQVFLRNGTQITYANFCENQKKTVEVAICKKFDDIKTDSNYLYYKLRWLQASSGTDNSSSLTHPKSGFLGRLRNFEQCIIDRLQCH